MYFLRQLKKFGLPHEILVQFYRAVMENALCLSLPVWFCNTTKDQSRRLNCVDRNAGRIVGCELPSLDHCTSSGLLPDQDGPLQTGPTQPMTCFSPCLLAEGTGC